jgi:hypothetical protein
MNARIRELKEQAMEWVPNQVDPDTKIRLLNAEKFAELIVRKCIKDCRDMFVVDSVSWNLLNEKLEHFGVNQ